MQTSNIDKSKFLIIKGDNHRVFSFADINMILVFGNYNVVNVITNLHCSIIVFGDNNNVSVNKIK